MYCLAELIEFFQTLAPDSLAEEWDNVGLLVGDESRRISAVMICLTLTPDVADEAIRRGAQLIVSHHPILFRSVKRITADTSEGRMLLAIIEAGIAVYSPHTSYDSASQGINGQLADLLQLSDVGVLRPTVIANVDDAKADNVNTPSISGTHVLGDAQVGAGRFGNLRGEMSLSDFNSRVKKALGISSLQYVGKPDFKVRRVGIACGSAAEFMQDAHRHGCQVLLTGEARFHACLEAEVLGIALVLAGHYATERPAIEHLAKTLAGTFGDLTVWASEDETDPLKWI